MNKVSAKKIITAAFLTGVVGLSVAPLGAGATSNDSNWRHNSHYRHDNRDRDHNRIISSWQAQRIAQSVFPRKHVVSVQLVRDNGILEYQVRFGDRSRVDVRARDGHVTYINNNWQRSNYHHSYHNNN